MKLEEKPTAQQKGRTSRCAPISQRVCTVAGVCTVILMGCTGAQVRTGAASLDCPVGWKNSHTKFEVGDWGPEAMATIKGYEGPVISKPAIMKEGVITVYIEGDSKGSDAWKLPVGTLLMGTLVAGENRYFGRFTQAQTPDNQTHPVCIQVYTPRPSTMPEGPDCPPGVGKCPAPGSKPGALKVFPRMYIQGTSRFQ